MNVKVAALRFGGPEVLELRKTDIPKPHVDELVIKVAYCGVGAIDGILRRGGLRELNPQPPFTPGIEVSGSVHAIGKNVLGFERGQLVAAIMPPEGGYAEYVRVKAMLAVQIPSTALLPAAASIVNLVTAYLLATQIVPLSADDHVGVHGATGGLGTACIQIFHYLQPKAYLTAIVRDASKKTYTQSLGCQIVLTTEEFLKDSVHSYSLIVDPIGGELRRASLTRLKPYGKLLAVGNVSNEYESTISSQQLWLEGKAVSGFNLALYAVLYGEKVREAMRDIVSALTSDKVEATPSRIFPLDKVQDAHRYLEGGALKGRILLKVGDQ